MLRTVPILLVACTVFAGAAAAASLTLEIADLPSDRGVARIVLVDSEAGYRGTAPVARIATAPIRDGKAVWSADDLRAGNYAAIVHHDENANGELDRPLFGLPLEPYGFSNGRFTAFGLPGWEDVRFEVGETAVRQTVGLRLNPFAASLLALRPGLPYLALIVAGLLGAAIVRRRRRRSAAAR